MKTAACNENGKRFAIEYPKEWRCEKIQIDGSLINSQEVQKCDYAFLIHCNKDKKVALLYVELKGRHLLEAINQLESTLMQLKDKFNSYAINEAHAVCSRIIPNMTSSAQNAAMRFKKRHGFTLRWHSQSGSIVIKN